MRQMLEELNQQMEKVGLSIRGLQAEREKLLDPSKDVKLGAEYPEINQRPRGTNRYLGTHRRRGRTGNAKGRG